MAWLGVLGGGWCRLSRVSERKKEPVLLAEEHHEQRHGGWRHMDCWGAVATLTYLSAEGVWTVRSGQKSRSDTVGWTVKGTALCTWETS